MQHNTRFLRTLIFTFLILVTCTIIIRQNVVRSRVSDIQDQFLSDTDFSSAIVLDNFNRYSEQILNKIEDDVSLVSDIKVASDIHLNEIIPIEKELLASFSSREGSFTSINDIIVSFVPKHRFVNSYKNAQILVSLQSQEAELYRLKRIIDSYYRSQQNLSKHRSSIYKKLQPYYTFLEIYSFGEIQVTLPDGVTLLRTSSYNSDNPEVGLYGDNQINTRESLKTICSAKLLTTFEADSLNTYYRVINPILLKQLHIASVETGIGLIGIERLAELNNSDWDTMALLTAIPEIDQAANLTGSILPCSFKDNFSFLNFDELEPGITKLIDQSLTDIYYSKLRNRFLNYEPFAEVINLNNQKKIIAFHPIRSYTDETLGYQISIRDFDELKILVHTRNRTILISVLSIFIVLMLAYYIRCKRGEKDRLNQALGTVTEKLLEGIVVVKRDGKVQFINKAATLFFNDTRENLLLLNAEEIVKRVIFPRKVEWQSIVDEIIENGFYTNDDTTIRIDNVSIAVSLLGVYISPEEKINHDFQDCIVLMLNDITHHKVYEQQLLEAMDSADTSNKLKSTFLNNFSHEVRTPLNSIIGFTYLLENDNPPKEDIAKYVDIISKNSHYLLSIVQNIIEISQLERDEYRISPDQFSVNELMKEIFNEGEHLIQESNKPIKLLCKTGLDDNADLYLSDRNRLKEIMVHLLDNAVKFTEFGKIEFGYRVHEADTLLFWINDSGIGIEDDEQSKIFQPFYQIKDGTHLKFSGTGLGLSIASKIVQLMGGNLWVKSEYAKGTTMYFALNFMTQDSIDDELAELGLDDY